MNHQPPVAPPQHGTPASTPQPSLYEFATEQEKLWQSVIANQALHRELLDGHKKLVELIAMLEHPAQLSPLGFTQQQQVIEDRERWEWATRSIGLYNPAGAPGNVQFNGAGTATAADAFIVPAGKLLVVPISAQTIECASMAALGAGQSHYAFLFRFFSVQPAYLGG